MGSNGSKEKEANYELECLGDHEDAINCVALSEDKSLLATGSEDKTIRMWSTRTEQTECLGILKGHNDYVTCLTICDTFVISGSADNTIRKWDMTTCECLVNYQGHNSRISRVLCTGKVIFSTSYDKTAKIWDFDPDLRDDEFEQTPFRSLEGHTRGVYPIIYIPSIMSDNDEENPLKFNIDDILITGSADHTARVWSPETGNMRRTLKGHSGPVTCMVTDPQGDILYTGSTDKTIRSWNIKSGECMREMEGHGGPVICLTVVDRLMYSGSQDGQSKCWVREFGDCTRTYKGHRHSVITVKFHEGLLYTGSGDTCIRAFDAKNGLLKRLFQGHEGAVTCICFVGEKLFSGSFDSSLRVWNLKSIKDDPNAEMDDDDEDVKFHKKQEKHLHDLERQLK